MGMKRFLKEPHILGYGCRTLVDFCVYIVNKFNLLPFNLTDFVLSFIKNNLSLDFKCIIGASYDNVLLNVNNLFRHGLPSF